MERSLGEICRSFEKKIESDKNTFFALNGFSTLAKVFHRLSDQKVTCVIPLKSVVTCSKTWTEACRGNKSNTEFVLKNNHLTAIVDILVDRLNVLLPKEKTESYDDEDDDDEGQQLCGPQVDPVAMAMMNLLGSTFRDLADLIGKRAAKKDQNLLNRVLDQV